MSVDDQQTTDGMTIPTELSVSEIVAGIRAALDPVVADPKDEQAAIRLFEVVEDSRRRRPDLLLDRALDARSPAVAQAREHWAKGREEEAEMVLRNRLAQFPGDTQAMQFMATIAVECGFDDNAEKILRRTTEIAPDNGETWLHLGRFLYEKSQRVDDRSLADTALDILKTGIDSDPSHYGIRSLRAGIQVQLRKLDEAEKALEQLLEIHPLKAMDWYNLAHVRKIVGEFAEAVGDLRVALAIDPDSGMAWYAVADLKLATFFDHDIELMERALKAGPGGDENEVKLRFALSRAYDQSKRPADAAPHLIRGNALQLERQPAEPEKLGAAIDRGIETYTRDYYDKLRGWGSDNDAPIFILGMPRSGSTLIEQILASHSKIEGTEELFIVHQLASELIAGTDAPVEERLLAQGPEAYRQMGDRYVALAADHRRTDRPFFTDKNPSNWTKVGMIHAILPKARIIDVRRNPLDCCFANYAQHFNWGAHFSYGQSEVAFFYRNYLRLMRHMAEAAPGAIHKIIYDDLVEDFEATVEPLFDYLGLELEPACLRFFETKRSVFTPSSEQVRRPINRSGVDRWKPYAPWLEEMQSALSQTVNDWR